LEPVSSVTGQTGKFFYTTDAAADGHKIHTPSGETNNYAAYSETTAQSDSNAGKTKYDLAFNSEYGISPTTAGEYNPAYGYVDYVFYLKATSDEASQEIRMTKCDLDYSTTNGALHADPADKAWRVAVFSTKLSGTQGGAGNTGEAGSDGATVQALDPAAVGNNAKSILTLSGAANFDGTAVATANSKSTPTYGTGAVLDTIATAGTTNYYKVTVRVWLEGEDTTCKSSTYAELNDAWSLDLDFKLTKSTTEDAAVTAISNGAWEPTKTVTQTAPATPVEP
jgi:hypothetical protein